MTSIQPGNSCAWSALPSRSHRCYLITVPRFLLLLLLMIALTLGNGAATAALICQHPDERAHAAALQSADAAVAAEAMSEDRAAGSAESDGTLVDGGSAALLGFVLPSEPELALRAPARASPATDAIARLAGFSPPPLLQPPLV